MVSYYRKKILSWLLPFTCVLCHRLSDLFQDICTDCLRDLPCLKEACIRCMRPMDHSLLCGSCLRKEPPFSQVYTLYLYQSPITHLIMNLKFNNALTHARILGELLACKIKIQWYDQKPLPEAIIPMPLHPKRLKERGFNQALEIARPIAKILRKPLLFKECIRVKHTAAQATLSAKDRQANVQGAFKISSIPYQHVAVVDDVITTGSTMNEFCETLKRSGVQMIDVLCCARPLPNGLSEPRPSGSGNIYL